MHTFIPVHSMDGSEGPGQKPLVMLCSNLYLKEHIPAHAHTNTHTHTQTQTHTHTHTHTHHSYLSTRWTDQSGLVEAMGHAQLRWVSYHTVTL